MCCVAPYGCAINPVTGKQEFSIVSEKAEIASGEKNYQKGQKAAGGVYQNDPVLSEYVNQVGHRLAKVSDRPNLPYEFVIINNSKPNAWSMPGGKIAINKGLLLLLENEAELAAVLSHEIVHAAARHSAQSLEQGILINTSVAILGGLLGGSGSGPLIGDVAGIGGSYIQSQYSQSAELEADFHGMQYMSKAGYNPQAAVTLQEKFLKMEKQKGSSIGEGIFSSHPPSINRLQANQKHIQTLPKGGHLGRDRYQQKIAALKRLSKNSSP